MHLVDLMWSLKTDGDLWRGFFIYLFRPGSDVNIQKQRAALDMWHGSLNVNSYKKTADHPFYAGFRFVLVSKLPFLFTVLK